MAFGAPMTIYNNTRDPLLSALPVAMLALGNILGSYCVRKLNSGISDKIGCVAIDLFAAAIVIVPGLLSARSHTGGIVAVIFLVAFLQTIRSGFNESLIGHLAKATGSSRQNFIGTSKLFVNSGALLGFAAAAPFATTFGAGAIFAANAMSFLLCAGLIALIPIPEAPSARKVQAASAFSLLFGGRLRWLSLSHGTAAISLWFVNAIAFFTLVDRFHAKGTTMSAYFCLQMIGAMIGSLLMVRVSRTRPLSNSYAPWLRFAYAAAILALALAPSAPAFIIGITLLYLVHSFSLPVWQSMFQQWSTEAEWRVVGASRKSLVSIVGGVSSLLAGYMYRHQPPTSVFLLAAVIALLSASMLYKFLADIRLSEVATASA